MVQLCVNGVQENQRIKQLGNMEIIIEKGEIIKSERRKKAIYAI